MQEKTLENKIIDLGLSYLENEDKIYKERIENKIRFIEKEINELMNNKPLIFKNQWKKKLEKFEDIKMDLYRELEQYI